MPKKSSILAVFLASYATPVFSAVMSRVSLSEAVARVSLPAKSEMMTLQIDLALDNTSILEEKLRDLSDPSSPNYGNWLTKEEVDALFPATTGGLAAVTKWLRNHGISRIHEDQGHSSSIRFAAPVGTVNALLNTTFAYYDVAGTRKLRTTSYSVPADVAPFIQLIHPTTFFGQTKSHHMPPPPSSPLAPSPSAALKKQVLQTNELWNGEENCTRFITPACLRSAYGIDDYAPSIASGSRIGFGSFLNESARLADLRAYQRVFGIPIPIPIPTPSQEQEQEQGGFTTVLINGGTDNQAREGNHVEANLDAQFQSAASHPLPQVQFVTGGAPPFVPSVGIPDAEHNTNEPYLEYYSFLLGKTNEELPQVISNSYGDDEQTVPVDGECYAKRVCDMIGMLGLRGITVLESSGDTGIGAPCLSNDGRRRLEFTPGFPASCPFVTAVGGTEAWAPEVAWVGSSGGFSNYFARPWYQRDAVATYLDKRIRPETRRYYEPFADFSGRAFPDISAHSLMPYYLFFNKDEMGQTGGTSAAAPVVAGIIALLNDARLRAGKPTMGFINPFLYGLGPGPITDITAGKAVGCNGYNMQTGGLIRDGGKIPWASWNGTLGWDPVTGMGIPNFQKMMVAALEL